MNIQHVLLTAIFLSLIGCGGGSSSSAAASATSGYDAAAITSTNKASYMDNENIILTVTIDNSGPGTITENFDIKMYYSKNGGPNILVEDVTSTAQIDTTFVVHYGIDLGPRTAGSYVFTGVATFANDTNPLNDFSIMPEIIVTALPPITAPSIAN